MPQHVQHKVLSLAPPPPFKNSEGRCSNQLRKYCIRMFESQLQDKHGISEGIEAITFDCRHFVKW